ncbi:MAG: RDD family protein, partial [Bacteroidales bacterium]|nr:RDD family protein [Bacteroidales bacterium]
FLNKDLFNGRSIAKRILKLKIVNHKTNQTAGPLRCLVRNITFPIWPIEIIVILINKNRRIGDFIAGTHTEFYSETELAGKRRPFNAIAALFISFLFVSGMIFLSIKTTKLLVETSNQYSGYSSTSGLRREYTDSDSLQVIHSYYDNGQMESETRYVYGKLNGWYRDWYENGNKKSQIPYVEGKREGVMTTWYSNGQKQDVMLYENNTYVRYLERWDIRGNPIPIDEEEETVWYY